MTIKVAGQLATERLMQQVRYRSRNMIGPNGVEVPSERQVAVVLHALVLVKK